MLWLRGTCTPPFPPHIRTFPLQQHSTVPSPVQKTASPGRELHNEIRTVKADSLQAWLPPGPALRLSHAQLQDAFLLAGCVEVALNKILAMSVLALKSWLLCCRHQSLGGGHTTGPCQQCLLRHVPCASGKCRPHRNPCTGASQSKAMLQMTCVLPLVPVRCLLIPLQLIRRHVQHEGKGCIFAHVAFHALVHCKTALECPACRTDSPPQHL